MLALDIAFGLGLLASGLKGADMIMRPHQQKKLQAWVEIAALKLSYCRTLNVILPFLRKLSYGKLVAFLAASNFVIFWIVYLFDAYAHTDIATTVEEFGIVVFILISVFLAVISGYVSADLYDGHIRAHLSCKTWREFAWRTFVVVEYTILLILFVNIFERNGIIRAPYFYFLAIYVGAYLSMAYFLLLLFGITIIAEITIKFSNAVVWRVAEYNKGAWAGIVLIATIILGVAELYVRHVANK